MEIEESLGVTGSQQTLKSHIARLEKGYPLDSIFKHECNQLARDRFPLSSKYHPQWVFDNEMGPNVLWLTEYLAEKLPIQSGDRVMDLGCGRALWPLT